MAKKRGLNGLGSTSLLLLAGGALALWLLMKPKGPAALPFKVYSDVSEIPQRYLFDASGRKTPLLQEADSLGEMYKNELGLAEANDAVRKKVLAWISKAIAEGGFTPTGRPNVKVAV